MKKRSVLRRSCQTEPFEPCLDELGGKAVFRSSSEPPAHGIGREKVQVCFEIGRTYRVDLRHVLRGDRHHGGGTEYDDANAVSHARAPEVHPTM